MTFTKSWLQKQITDLEATRDEIPFGLDEDGNNTLAALKLALAGMEAEPVVSLGLLSVQKARPLKSARKMLESDNCDGCTHYSSEICHGGKCAAPQPATVVPDEIDDRMKSAGMLSAAEIISGQPIDAFMKNAGVVDLDTLLKWSEMRRAEFLRMQAKYELGDSPQDDMYEWVISHVAAFSELHVNIRAAMLQGAEPVTAANKLEDGENCWSCGKYFTYAQHSECDGYCPHCDSPVDLDDEEEQSSKLVPLEPTEEMISNAWREAIGKCDHETIKRIYETMLAAAPQQEVKP